ncbi:Protein phosphatase 1G [Geodia barretti]|uniref:protein-serine/threonine phosphatase n=2 Tax=Geodia barretti TaxID=519541 RepID=A0AA35RY93_GEOBA|nr:Protein phosphatase 1G [Geodia barretti]
MSEDHKPTDEPELSRIQRAGGHVGADGRVNGGLNLSRAIGDHFYKENSELSLEEQMITALPDVQSRSLQTEDEFVVLACDGIWNTKSSQEVVDFVGQKLREGVREREMQSLGALLETVCEELCDDCLAADTDNDGTGCDNMTATIVLLSPPSPSLPSLPPPI